MFEVGDRVRYVPNERRDSYQGFIGRRGTVVHVYERYRLYPYRVEFDGVFDGKEYYCSEAELERTGYPLDYPCTYCGKPRGIPCMAAGTHAERIKASRA